MEVIYNEKMKHVVVVFPNGNRFLLHEDGRLSKWEGVDDNGSWNNFPIVIEMDDEVAECSRCGEVYTKFLLNHVTWCPKKGCGGTLRKVKDC